MILLFCRSTFGGSIGGGLGFMAMQFNNQVLRTRMSWVWKKLDCLTFTIIAGFLYFIIALPLSLLLR